MALAPAVPPPPRQFAVRVREVGGTAFRRVVLRDAEVEHVAQQVKHEVQGGPPSFAEVESRLCTKFRTARGPDGTEVGPRRLVTLVRLSDSLELGDDEDVALLHDGDELEATFAAL